ncbi:MAG: hypothetical protein AAF799_31720 [Myxococcota bacterium]
MQRPTPAVPSSPVSPPLATLLLVSLVSSCGTTVEPCLDEDDPRCFGDTNEDGGSADEARGSFDPTQPIVLSTATGASVAIPADGLVCGGEAPTGPVEVQVGHPVREGSELADMPGGFLGRTMEGESVALASFGVISVEITDADGTPCNLAPGVEAQIAVPFASGGFGSTFTAPDEVPLWHLERGADFWVEEGVARYEDDAGDYRGSVTHFSSWNVDRDYFLACLRGTVVYSDGSPVPNAAVQFNVTTLPDGLDPNRVLSGDYTEAGLTGSFELDSVPAGANGTITAVDGDGESGFIQYSVPDSGFGCIDVGQIVIDGGGEQPDTCGDLSGTLWGNEADEPNTAGDYRLTDLSFRQGGEFRSFYRWWDSSDGSCNGVYNDTLNGGSWSMDGCEGTVVENGTEYDVRYDQGDLLVAGLRFRRITEPQSPFGCQVPSSSFP